jgi:hypothetical protein
MGFGLYNVFKRIQLYYEIDNGLTIESDYKGVHGHPAPADDQFSGPGGAAGGFGRRGMMRMHTVFLVEDEPLIRQNIRKAIEKNGDRTPASVKRRRGARTVDDSGSQARHPDHRHQDALYGWIDTGASRQGNHPVAAGHHRERV